MRSNISIYVFIFISKKCIVVFTGTKALTLIFLETEEFLVPGPI